MGIPKFTFKWIEWIKWKCQSLFTFCLTMFSLLCFYVTLLLFYLTSCLFFFKCLIFVFYCENTPWVKTIDAIGHKRLKMDLKIGSINVRGLGDQVKRREIFNWLRAKQIQYILFTKCTVQKTIRMIGRRMGLWSFIQLLHQWKGRCCHTCCLSNF